ncbi:MAG: RluA family pseudouridine synthase [Thiobacillus sp.]|nr:RluA family pseudouridine synthase [Thiobacillus sp.]
MSELVPLYADDSLLVFDKASGLLAVPGRGPDKQDSLSARAQAVWPDARIVHRLDMDTSGIMLLARGAAAQRRLSMDFEARLVNKRYIAVVAGRLDPPEADWGVIDLPIILDWQNRPLSIVDPVHGKPSLTRWRVLGHEGGNTRVELEPVSGRSHQLRVHMRALGHPILGDPLYASPEGRAMADRLLLHACYLAINHPVSGAWLSFESRPPF